MSQIIIILTIIAYLLLMLYIGWICSKKNSSVDDFYLGGRQLGPLVTAMSAEASDMSSWLLMGLPGVAYLSGMASASWTAIGLAAGTYINWLIVAKRIRLYSKSYDAFTLPDFFARRFGDEKHVITLISAVIIIVFFIPYTASGFAACGKLFSSIFGVDYTMAMIVSAAVIIAYCTMGGFLAASTTDLIQSIIMTIALFIILAFGVNIAGGMDVIMANARALPGYLSLTQSYDPVAKTATPYDFVNIISTAAWGLGYFGMPHILLRFMAIKDEDKLKISRRVASVWAVISMGIAVFIGIIGYSMSKAGAIPVLTGSASETIIVRASHLLSTFGAFPAICAGVILAGILAATMSTSDSQLLAAASSFSQNIVTEFFGKTLSEKNSMRAARWTVIAIAVIGIVIARNPDSSVFEIVSFAWAGFGATFGPVVLASLFWRGVNRQGVIAGMLSGGVMIFLWKYGIAKLGGIFAIYELLPAFIVAILAMFLVSKLTGSADPAVVAEFDAVKAENAAKLSNPLN